jgi:2-succinyl-6-hydroxy-2,4-cyclohexadiene-1-carboxylate synthase
MDGRSRDTPVTCLHGFSQRGDSWGELTALVPGPYRWLTPDLEGTTMGEVEAELLDLWRRQGVGRTHLVGYSQGGRVALFLASRRPERLLSLATIGAHAGFEGEERRRRLAEDLALADRIERDGIDWFAGYWAGLPMFAGLARRGPALRARLDRARRSHDPVHLAATLRGLGPAATAPFWDLLDRIDVPTMVLAGAADERYVEFADRLRAMIRGARVAIVPGAGHAAHLESPEAVAAILARHFAAASRGATPPAGPGEG